MQELVGRYGLTYTTGSLPRQVGSAWKKVIRLSLPNDFGRKARATVLRSAATPGGPPRSRLTGHTTSKSSVWIRLDGTPRSEMIRVAAATIGPGPQMK